MTIERNHACIVITDIIDDQYFKRRYIGYTIKEAKMKFLKEVKREVK